MHLDFQQALLNVLLLWILTAPHEFAHAWVATRLGDDTPRRDGRVTLYPLAHVDWLGTTILPFVTSLLGGGLLGWGKPVRTDTSKLKGGLNGLALVALAGPFSNVILAVVLAVLAVLSLQRAAGLRPIRRAGCAAQPVPGDLQPPAGSTVGRFEAAVSCAHPHGGLRRARALWFHAADRGSVGFRFGPLDKPVELPRRACHLRSCAVSPI